MTDRHVCLVDLYLDRCGRTWGACQGRCAGWDNDWLASSGLKPSASTPAWAHAGGDASSFSGGLRVIGDNGTTGDYDYAPSVTVGANQDVIVTLRLKVQAGFSTAWVCQAVICHPTNSLYTAMFVVDGNVLLQTVSAAWYAATTTDLFTLKCVLHPTGDVEWYFNGTLAHTGTAFSGTIGGMVGFGRPVTVSDTHEQYWEFVRAAAGRDPDDYELGHDPCHGTYATCQAQGRYQRTNTTPRRYTMVGGPDLAPSGIQAAPAIKKIGLVPTVVDMERGLGARPELSVEFADWVDGHELSDPYWRQRPSSLPASHFGVLKEADRHFENRQLVLRYGSLDDAGRISLADMATQTYWIQGLTGPSDDGVTKVVAKDLFKLLDKAKTPRPSTGTLSSVLTAGATSLYLQSGDGADYVNTLGSAPGAGAANWIYVYIGSEMIRVEGRSGDSLTSLTRGCGGTVAAEHDIGETVQLVRHWEDVATVDVWRDLQLDGGIPLANIDYAGASTEAAVWLKGYRVTRYVTSPTDIRELISSLVRCSHAFTWCDPATAKSKFHVVRPAAPGENVVELTDESHLVEGTVKPEDCPEMRINGVTVHCGVRDWSASLDDVENYTHHLTHEDDAASSTNEYGDVKDYPDIFACWYPSSMASVLSAVADRILDRFRDTPRQIKFSLCTKDEYAVLAGGLVTLSTRRIVAANGSRKPISCWVLSKRRRDADSELWDYACLSDLDQSSVRYAYWNDPSAPNYDLASDSDKECAYWADPTTEKVGEDPPYCWQ